LSSGFRKSNGWPGRESERYTIRRIFGEKCLVSRKNGSDQSDSKEHGSENMERHVIIASFCRCAPIHRQGGRCLG
ncbi:hypothetical protein CLOM_g24526, partial [Closterium sp. NIES-68]